MPPPSLFSPLHIPMSLLFRPSILILVCCCWMQYGCVSSADIHPLQKNPAALPNEAPLQSQPHVGRSHDRPQSDVATNLIAFLDGLQCKSSDTPVWTESTDICTWGDRSGGVKCNDNSEPIEIDLSSYSCEGSIDFTKLPASLQFLNLTYNQLSGSIDLTQLASSLQYLDLHSNQLSGSIDLTQLPSSMVSLAIDSNQLSGPIDLTQLPSSLLWLYLHWNQLSGSIDLTQLPSSLQQLYLFGNQLSGSIDLTQLPSSMVALAIDSNQLSGSIDLTKLPSSLLWLHLNSNQLSGSIDLTQLPSSLQQLYLMSNQLSGSIDLTQLPSSLQQLWLSSNQLSGSIDLTQLASSLQFLNIASNQLSGSIDLTQLPSSLSDLELSDNSFSSLVADSSVCDVTLLTLSNNRWRCPLPADPACLASAMGTCVPVDCQGEFVNIADCSKTCGSGKLTQRFTILVAPTEGGKACKPKEGATRSVKCNTQKCPTNCQGKFKNFGKCSKTCGSGVQKQKYFITKKAANGGIKCPFAVGATQTIPCTVKPCPAVNCVGKFVNSGKCSKSCGGGVQKQKYIITKEAGKGGTTCLHAAGERQTVSCNISPCQSL